MTTFSSGMETIVQKAMSMKQEVEDVLPKDEELREYLNEHHVRWERMIKDFSNETHE